MSGHGYSLLGSHAAHVQLLLLLATRPLPRALPSRLVVIKRRALLVHVLLPACREGRCV